MKLTVNSITIRTMFGLSEVAVRDISEKTYGIFTISAQSTPEQIGGNGVVVQIDESKFVKVKYHRGHRVDGVWVLGGVERTPEKRTFLIVIEDRTKSTLENYIIKYVKPGFIIHIDCWRSYSSLNSLGYQHYVVNHSKNFKDPITGTHTNNIEGI